MRTDVTSFRLPGNEFSRSSEQPERKGSCAEHDMVSTRNIDDYERGMECSGDRCRDHDTSSDNGMDKEPSADCGTHAQSSGDPGLDSGVPGVDEMGTADIPNTEDIRAFEEEHARKESERADACMHTYILARGGVNGNSKNLKADKEGKTQCGDEVLRTAVGRGVQMG